MFHRGYILCMRLKRDTKTAYNSFKLCEGYIGSIYCSKRSMRDTNSSLLRCSRERDKTRVVRTLSLFSSLLHWMERNDYPFLNPHSLCEGFFAVSLLKDIAPQSA